MNHVCGDYADYSTDNTFNNISPLSSGEDSERTSVTNEKHTKNATSTNGMHSSCQYGEIPSNSIFDTNITSRCKGQSKQLYKKRKNPVPRSHRLQSTTQTPLLSVPNEFSCQSSSDESDSKPKWRQHKMKRNLLQSSRQRSLGKKSESLEVVGSSSKNKKTKKNSKEKNIVPRKAFSKPFPRSAPCGAGTDLCSTDSGCNEESNGPCTSASDCSGRDINFMRTMKAKMIKLEDTLDLMYRKFRLHEDNIDEIQERLYVYQFGTPGCITTKIRFYIALSTCTVLPIVVVELLYAFICDLPN